MTIRYAPEWPDAIGPHVREERAYSRLCFVPWCPKRSKMFFGERPLCGSHALQQARAAKREAAEAQR